MLKTNPQLRHEALQMLKGKWLNCTLAFVILLAVNLILCTIPSINFFSFLITLPLSYGYSIFYLRLAREDAAPEVSVLGDGFKEYSRIFITMFLITIYTFLWALLFIVPGVIKGLSYALTPYILKDRPELSNNAAIELSMAMMDGHKMRLFLMTLNFIMWFLVSILTLGIGLFWFSPYAYTTMALFYEDVKRDYEANNL